MEEKIKELEQDAHIEYAEPNFKRFPTIIATNDIRKDELWALEGIDVPEAWAVNEGTNGPVIVAVIDTGVAYTHPDLAANMWDGASCKDENGNALGGCSYGYDFEDGDAVPLPTWSSHGTHVAGTIAAAKNNGIGIIGVAPHAKIMALKFAFDTASEVQAIDFAIQNGAKVINASYGGAGFSQAEYDAIARFQAAGGIFVAAAGNSARDNDLTSGEHHNYPSDHTLDAVIAVAATDQSDTIASFSSFGPISVDVGAPGTDILSTIAGSQNSYTYANGTSMASPHVAGLAALLWGYQPTLTATAVKDAIVGTGDALTSLAGKTVSGKRINAHNALQSVVIPEPTPTIEPTISPTPDPTPSPTPEILFIPTPEPIITPSPAPIATASPAPEQSSSGGGGGGGGGSEEPQPAPILKKGKVLGAKTVAVSAKDKKAKDYIISKHAPIIVSQVFRTVFGKDIKPAESTYWKNRARTDKATQYKLKGAMLFQKFLDRTMPLHLLTKK